MIDIIFYTIYNNTKYNMMSATVKQLQTLFSKLGFEKTQRHQRIHAWTSGRTQSANDLQPDELDDLCQALKQQVNAQKEVLEAAKRQRRSVILKIATKVGIKHPTDWDSFNHFMLHNSVAKKTLPLCSIEELDQVHQQFRALEANYERSGNKPGTKAYFNQFGMPPLNNN